MGQWVIQPDTTYTRICTHAPIATRGNNWLAAAAAAAAAHDAVSPCRNLSATRDAMATRLLAVAKEPSVAIRYSE